MKQDKKQCVVCLEPKTKEGFRVFVNGELSKICKVCHGKKISESRQKNKHESVNEKTPEIQLDKRIDHSDRILARKDFNKAMKKYSDLNGKIIIMNLTDFYSVLKAVHEDGSNNKNTPFNSIEEVDLSVIVEQALKQE